MFSMKQLRDRVMKLREDHDHIYHLTRSEGMPSVNWGKIMDEKLVRGRFLLTQTHSLARSHIHTHPGTQKCFAFPMQKPVLTASPHQSNLNNKGFGQDLPTIENEVEEHNIFHSEVEALAPHITSSDDKVRHQPLTKYHY